jgi:hypothetical protein
MEDVTLRLLQKKTVTLQLCTISAPWGSLIDDGENMVENMVDFWEKSTMFSTMFPPFCLT